MAKSRGIASRACALTRAGVRLTAPQQGMAHPNGSGSNAVAPPSKHQHTNTTRTGDRMIPARDTLRAAYDVVIKEIDSGRAKQQLTNAFYAKIADSIFDACYSALEHSH